MTPKPLPISAVCPMCGCENRFAPADLTPAEVTGPGSELDTSLRGTCRTCGERFPVQAPRTAASGRKAGRGEAIVALTVLAVLLAAFVFFMLSMFKP